MLLDIVQPSLFNKHINNGDTEEMCFSNDIPIVLCILCQMV